MTDINVALGLVPGESFGGGSVTIDRAAGEKALERLGRGIGKSADEVAFGAWRIVNANMAHAIRQLTVYRGIDPRAFSLFSFGSAAGQHAVEVARELRMPRVVVPAAAPVFSAVGMLAARLETYGSASVEKVVDRMFEDRAVAERISALENDLLREADDPRGLLRIWTLECRHVGQTRTINIDFHPATDTSDAVRDRFLDEHRRLYGMHGETGVEVVNARLCVATADPEHRAWRPGQSTTSDIVAMTSSEVLMDGMAVDIVPRAALSPDDEGEGPALIADSSSTVYIPSDCRWRMDAFGSLVVEL